MKQSVGLVSLMVAIALAALAFAFQTNRLLLRPGKLIAQSAADLEPDHPLPPDQELVMARVRLPVKVKNSLRNHVLNIDSVSHGCTFESESYVSSPSQFMFVGVNDEQFVPPIPLLTFPLVDGDSATYEGQFRTGGSTIGESMLPIRAKVNVKRSKLVLANGPQDTIEVSVVAEYVSLGQKDKATRTFVFDFVPHHGILKRSFSGFSDRQVSQN